MKYFLIAIAQCLAITGFAQSAPTPLGAVKDGVYFAQNHYSTCIIELRDGVFRYWFASDAKIIPEPTYPLSGKYTVKDGTVTLPHKDIYQQEWTFITFDRKVTLWRRAALAYWDETKKIDHYGVLFSTDRKPENIWERKH